MSKATIAVEGFVTKDPELRQVNGKDVIAVDIAHTPRKKDRDTDQWVDAGDTIWFQASFWDRDAQPIAASLRKGTLVTVTGIPELNVYQRQDGSTAATIRIKGGTLGIIPREAQQGRGSANTAAPAPWDAPAKTSPQTAAQDAWPAGSNYTDETPW
jgi:single stranded DNA-binding protein